MTHTQTKITEGKKLISTAQNKYEKIMIKIEAAHKTGSLIFSLLVSSDAQNWSNFFSVKE